MEHVLLPQIDLRYWGTTLVCLWCVSVVLFEIWPELDLIVASWFWTPHEGFGFQQSPIWPLLRYTLWNAQIAIFVASLLMFCIGLWLGRAVFGVSVRVSGFVFTLFLLGPGLLVNAVLKDHGGRARPADISDFGGQAVFTPPWVFTDQCARNCAFPSGEVSSAVVMAIVIWLGAAMTGFGVFAARASGVAIVGFACMQRITDGRHFVSDVMFAVLMTATLAWGLYALFCTRIRRR